MVPGMSTCEVPGGGMEELNSGSVTVDGGVCPGNEGGVSSWLAAGTSTKLLPSRFKDDGGSMVEVSNALRD